MTVALAVVFGAYLVVLLGIAWTIRSHPAIDPLPDAALPTVAIVVAARDEEGCIGRCLDALQAQDYPAGRLTLLVADDHSTDGTAGVVRQRAEAGGAHAVRYLRVPDPVGHLRGKAQALHTAFEAVDADVVLITDADCAPVPTWARTLASAFADESVGIACGLARLEERDGRTFDRVQALDWELLIGAVSAGYRGRSMSSHIESSLLAASARSTSAGATWPSNTVFTVGTLRCARRGRRGDRSDVRLNRVARPPSRRTEDEAEPVAPPSGAADVARNGHVLVRLQRPDVVGVHLLGEPVVGPAGLQREAAEHPVPDDEDAAVVLVQVLLVHAVVHAVV